MNTMNDYSKNMERKRSVIKALEERNAELEKKIKITYIEGQIEGIESVDNWIDGYYAFCVTAKLQELWEETTKLEQGK